MFLGQTEEIRMGERMVSNLMPLSIDAPHEVGICLSLLPDQEEAGMKMVLTENIEYSRSPIGVRSIVESKN